MSLDFIYNARRWRSVIESPVQRLVNIINRPDIFDVYVNAQKPGRCISYVDRTVPFSFLKRAWLWLRGFRHMSTDVFKIAVGLRNISGK